MTTIAHFHDSTRKRLGQTTFFPGQRIEGYIELDSANPPSRLVVTLRRVARYSALETEEHPMAIKSVASLLSQHQLLGDDPQTSTFFHEGSASRIPFSLILSDERSIPSISGHIEYEATLTGAKGRILDSVAPIFVSPWTWNSASPAHSLLREFMVTRPWAVDFSTSGLITGAAQIPVEPKSYETDAYHFAKHGLRIAIHADGCQPGQVTPVMLLVIATEARKVDPSSVDWDVITPKLPGEPGYKDEFEIWLQPTLTSTSNEQTADGELHYATYSLPEMRIGPVQWRTGHLSIRDGDVDAPSSPEAETPFPCPGYAFSAPSVNRSDNDWPAKMAYLVGDLAIPANAPPSFESSTRDGWIKLEYELCMTYSPANFKYEDNESVDIKVAVVVTSARARPSTATEDEGVDQSAPPLYSE